MKASIECFAAVGLMICLVAVSHAAAKEPTVHEQIRPDGLCHPTEKLYRDYQGAVRYGNIFSLDVGPDYAGRLRDIDVQTLREVG